jgi:hypothetical protein
VHFENYTVNTPSNAPFIRLEKVVTFTLTFGAGIIIFLMLAHPVYKM